MHVLFVLLVVAHRHAHASLITASFAPLQQAEPHHRQHCHRYRHQQPLRVSRRSRTAAPALLLAPTPLAPARAADRTLLGSFLSLFRGHFDNHVQHVAELGAGLAPRQGGGHEHIHCALQHLGCAAGVVSPGAPAGAAHVLATYYFDGEPDSIFRERLYRIEQVTADAQFGDSVRMQILRLRPQTAAQLRAAGGDTAGVAWTAADGDTELRVPNADVFWREVGPGRFEGRMRSESIELISERSGEPLIVRDDVVLSADALWVNDRGEDAEGCYVYGNIHGVPYKMARVSDDHWTSTGGVQPEGEGA
jgi:hypothetical protein